MKNWATFLFISIAVFVVLSDCAVKENPRPKNPKKRLNLTSKKPTTAGRNRKNPQRLQTSQPLPESHQTVPKSRSSSKPPFAKAQKTTTKKRRKGRKRNRTTTTTTFRPTAHQPRPTAGRPTVGFGPSIADVSENRSLRAGQPLTPEAPCCPGCLNRAVNISKKVFDFISRYDYYSMTQLDKVDIKPVLETAGARRRRTPQCSRMLHVKQRFYQADVYLYGCTDQLEACSTLCKDRAECKSVNFVPEAKLCLLSTSADSLGSRSFAADLRFDADYLEKTRCGNHDLNDLTPPRTANKQPSPRKKKRSLRGGTSNIKLPIKKRAVGQWSGVPGVAFFGFKLDERRIDPSSGSLAVSSVPHALPWLVNLALNHGKRCAGVIIPWMTGARNSSSFVLTAAHCLK
uniref:Apple domain-containing protein n=1 Tax=Romanomermis culicivorax TaxID=13658 RepID=A0A915L507_ROMCU